MNAHFSLAGLFTARRTAARFRAPGHAYFVHPGSSGVKMGVDLPTPNECDSSPETMPCPNLRHRQNAVLFRGPSRASPWSRSSVLPCRRRHCPADQPDHSMSRFASGPGLRWESPSEWECCCLGCSAFGSWDNSARPATCGSSSATFARRRFERCGRIHAALNPVARWSPSGPREKRRQLQPKPTPKTRTVDGNLPDARLRPRCNP